MRKVILVMVFALASFSISGVNTLNPEADNGCEKYAMDLAIEEADGAISDMIFL